MSGTRLSLSRGWRQQLEMLDLPDRTVDSCDKAEWVMGEVRLDPRGRRRPISSECQVV